MNTRNETASASPRGRAHEGSGDHSLHMLVSKVRASELGLCHLSLSLPHRGARTKTVVERMKEPGMLGTDKDILSMSCTNYWLISWKQLACVYKLLRVAAMWSKDCRSVRKAVYSIEAGGHSLRVRTSLYCGV